MSDSSSDHKSLDPRGDQIMNYVDKAQRGEKPEKKKEKPKKPKERKRLVPTEAQKKKYKHPNPYGPGGVIQRKD